MLLSIEGNNIPTSALLDSGEAGNFMSHEFARQHKIQLIPCTSNLAPEALDGRPLGEGRVMHTTVALQLETRTLHTESIRFYVITSPYNPVILGLPWLRQHNPLISWKKGRIIQWDSSCQANCLIDNPAISVQAIMLTDKPVLSSTLPFGIL